MKRIELFEQVVTIEEIAEQGLNRNVVFAYQDSFRLKRDKMDFDDIFSPIDEIVDELEKFDVNEITISYSGTALLNYLKQFDDRGFKVCGMEQIDTGRRDFDFKTRETKVVMADAIILRK